jgi:phage terminase large subunit-like protein
MPVTRKRPSSGPKKPTLTATWRKLLLCLPGYDPIATADDAWFDPVIAQKMLDFFPLCLRHIEGAVAGQPFHLEPWQQSLVANLFGWQRLDERGRQVRRYRELFLYAPRKQGKSPLCAGLGLAVLFCDDEYGQQNYIAAGDREQAGKLFRYARAMVERDTDLASRCRIYGGNATAGQSRSIVIEQEASFLRIIATDAETAHGDTTHLAIIDELHVQNSRAFFDTIRTSFASLNRRQPLFIQLTTADYDRPSICNEQYSLACRIRDGQIKRPDFLPVIYEAPKVLDGAELDYSNPAVYQNERIWEMSNPNLDVSVSRAYLRGEFQRAQETPGYLPTVLRLHLNVRTQQQSLWLDLQKWDASAGMVDAEELLGQACWAGLDLGATSDLTSLCLLFPDADGSCQALWYNWVPEITAKKRAQRGDPIYLEALERGELSFTEGDETDYSVIRAAIQDLAERYAIQEIAVDRLFQGVEFCQHLGHDGFTVVPFGQGFLSMAAPTQELERLVNRGAFHHGGNRLVRWTAGNCVVRRDPAGNLKPDKEKSAEKIDPMVAAIMALGRCMVRDQMLGSVYETRGMLML